MRTDKMTRKLKNPYVLLNRCSLEDINQYKSKVEGRRYSIDSAREEQHPINGNNRRSGVIDDNGLWNNGRVFSAYVLLERLTAHDIQNFLSKKDKE